VDKIIISCSDHFIEEKKYVFEILFNQLLEIDFELQIQHEHTYKICYRDAIFHIVDDFFKNINSDDKYYHNQELIPKEISLLNVVDYGIVDLPVLFGNGEYRAEDNSYYFGSDFIASAFFMLTRWEEIAITERDNYDRFPEDESLSIKNEFHKRPLVNEYADLFGKFFREVGREIDIKRAYRLFLTHDIDDFARYDSYSKFIKALAGDLLKRKSLKSFFRTISDFYNIKFKGVDDVYNTFSFLMDESERIGVKSAFYFIAGKLGETDVRFDIDRRDVSKIIELIEKREHIVGIHPGFDTLDNFANLKIELDRLKKYCENIEEGRQHYLRVKLPDTWNHWVDAGLKIDSSIGFYSHIGFRAGICCEFETFDVLKREKTGLIERPLIVMDTALRRLVVLQDDAVSEIVLINDIVRKFKGDFVLLWHNSNLTRNEWQNWDRVYQKILDIIKV